MSWPCAETLTLNMEWATTGYKPRLRSLPHYQTLQYKTAHRITTALIASKSRRSWSRLCTSSSLNGKNDNTAHTLLFAQTSQCSPYNQLHTWYQGSRDLCLCIHSSRLILYLQVSVFVKCFICFFKCLLRNEYIATVGFCFVMSCDSNMGVGKYSYRVYQ